MKRVEEGGKGREMTRKYIREAIEKKISVTVRNMGTKRAVLNSKNMFLFFALQKPQTHATIQTDSKTRQPPRKSFFFSFGTQNTFIGIHLAIYTLFLPPSLTSLCLSVSIHCMLLDYLSLLSVCVLLPLQWKTLAAQGVK